MAPSPEKELLAKKAAEHRKKDLMIRKHLDAHPDVSTPNSDKKVKRSDQVLAQLEDGLDINRVVGGGLKSEVLRLRGDMLTFTECCQWPWSEKGYDVTALLEPSVDKTAKRLTLNFKDGRYITMEAIAIEGIDMTEAFRKLYKQRASVPTMAF